jgi:hypothetical protein
MAIVLVMLGVACVPVAAYLLAPLSQRRGVVRALPALSAIMFAAVILFILSVNLGWVSP